MLGVGVGDGDFEGRRRKDGILEGDLDSERRSDRMGSE